MKVLMLPVISGKPWNGLTVLSQPLGGSESAVAYLAKAFTRLGHSVTVCTHGEPCKDETGVQYVGQDYAGQFQKEWDVVISSRWAEALRWEWKTQRRVLWMHDVISQQTDLQIHAQTHVVMLSKFHMSPLQFEGPMPRTWHIIGDGWDATMGRRVRGQERDPNRLIWLSNPDRGLCIASRIFQEIRKRWPDMELHVFGRSAVYGWGPDIESVFLPLPEHSENVFLHDPLPRSLLVKEIARSWAMFYPTHWPETYCMAALEAQSMGTPVVSSPIGALPETVQGGILTYDYLNAISQLKNQSRWNKLSAAGIEFAATQTWDVVAERWQSEVLNG